MDFFKVREWKCKCAGFFQRESFTKTVPFSLDDSLGLPDCIIDRIECVKCKTFSGLCFRCSCGIRYHRFVYWTTLQCHHDMKRSPSSPLATYYQLHVENRLTLQFRPFICYVKRYDIYSFLNRYFDLLANEYCLLRDEHFFYRKCSVLFYYFHRSLFSESIGVLDLINLVYFYLPFDSYAECYVHTGEETQS